MARPSHNEMIDQQSNESTPWKHFGSPSAVSLWRRLFALKPAVEGVNDKAAIRGPIASSRLTEYPIALDLR